MIQRYDDGMCGLEPDDDGDYVLYEDYALTEQKYLAMLDMNKFLADKVKQLKGEL
tara:strand:+ start:544 stop:708 length:165 start_codon:yes stop_codon:yes gene_type:complete